MSCVQFTTDPELLAALACDALVRQVPVRLELPVDWERPRNFPLPILVVKDSRVRNYRPMAIFEWVNAELSSTKTQEVAP